jgi:hypothetical protein
MRRGLAVLLVFGMAVAGCSGDGKGDDGDAAPVAVRTARAQLDWALTSGAAATDETLADRFDAAFLAAAPPEAIRFLLSNVAGSQVTEVTASHPNTLVAVVTSAIGVRYTATVSLASKAPHRVVGLAFHQAGLPDAPASWPEVDRRLQGLADRASILVAEVGKDGSITPVHELDADAIAPVGSVFKLYVLGALVEAVRAGKVGWDDEVTIEDGDVSFAGGLETLAGKTLPMRHLANLMISRSDNHAADAIIRTVGRPAVEAMLEPMGMGAASRARTLPFLTAREAFTLKWGSRAADYAAADEAGRRAILAELDEPLPDPFKVDLDKPVEVERVEWFATAEEVAAAHRWLDAARTGPDRKALDEVLGSNNPGLVLDPATWRRGAFKGGSEAGVLTLSWLLERTDGRRFVVVMQSASPTRPIDGAEGASIAYGAIDLVAHAH